MFSSFTDRIRAEVETLKLVLNTHDRLRALLFLSLDPPAGDAEKTAVPTDAKAVELEEIRGKAPFKSAWQVYDHCAAFTRLYAVYEQFVEDIASDYLRMLPELFEHYEDLPLNVTKQHRIGIGQILLKLGKDGPFKDLEEQNIIKNLFEGLSGGSQYVLLRDAFLIDPQNYRADNVRKLFSYLGIDDCWASVESHPIVLDFMSSRRDKTESPKTVLHDFVKYRNEASHTRVDEIVATAEIQSYADFIVAICEALAQIVMKQAIKRRLQIGHMTIFADVIHTFSDSVVGVTARVGAIKIGDELTAVGKYSCYKVTILSIQIERTSFDELEVRDGQQLGIKLSPSVRKGFQLLKLVTTTVPAAQETSEPSSPDDFPIPADPEAEAASESIDAELS